MRDPKMDPQPGDVLYISKPSGERRYRYVIARRGNDIDYTLKKGDTKVKTCWISTWMEWAVNADIEDEVEAREAA